MTNDQYTPWRLGLFKEGGSSWALRLSLWHLYLGICLALVVVVGLAILLILYTPLPTILGTGESYRPADQAMIDRIERLQDRMNAQEQFIIALQRRLSGDHHEPFIKEMEDQWRGDSVVSVARSPLDDSLRLSVERTNVSIPVRIPVEISDRVAEPASDHLLVPPVSGEVSNTYDLASGHLGVDLVAPEHTAVKAALEGHVVECDWTLRGGNTIIIQHDGELLTVYKHNAALLKQKGDVVKAGEAIAIIGNTGLHTDGPHVHFELWQRGEPLDPIRYLPL